MATKKQAEAFDELAEGECEHIEPYVEAFIGGRVDELKKEFPDRRAADWDEIERAAKVGEDDIVGIADKVVYASRVMRYNDEDARDVFGIDGSDMLRLRVSSKLNKRICDVTYDGDMIKWEIVDRYDEEMRPTGFPTLKRLMRERGIAAERIMQHCDTDRLPTVYDRINHHWMTFSPCEMQRIHGWLFADVDPLVLFDLNKQDVECIIADHSAEILSCKNLLMESEELSK